MAVRDKLPVRQTGRRMIPTWGNWCCGESYRKAGVYRGSSQKIPEVNFEESVLKELIVQCNVHTACRINSIDCTHVGMLTGGNQRHQQWVVSLLVIAFLLHVIITWIPSPHVSIMFLGELRYFTNLTSDIILGWFP